MSGAVDRLRTDQHDLLVAHRERALDAMLVASAGHRSTTPLRATPEGRALLAEPPDRLASIAISAAAATVERRRIQEESANAGRAVRLRSTDVFPGQVLETLARRRLPFSAEDAELLLDLGAAAMRPDHPTGASFVVLSFAVSAASRLLDVEHGSPVVLAALGRASTAADDVRPEDAIRAARIGGRILALLAANVPGGLLDLSIFDRRDGWSRPARDALRRHGQVWSGAQLLVALIAGASGASPTRAWRRRSSELAGAYPAYGDLLHALLEPLLMIEVVASGLPRTPVWLLAPRNEVVAKGAAWAAADVDAPWTAPLLGRLALRCAAPTPHPSVRKPLSHAVARGAIEALGLLGTEPAQAELSMLLGEIRRRDLLGRIAAILGEPAERTRARDERLLRERRRASRRSADPLPRKRRRAASDFVRRDLAPALELAGFDDSAGRMFWRQLDDRVELLHCKVHRSGITLELGIWFRFVPRTLAVSEHDGRPRPGEGQCDLRGTVHAPIDDLGSASRSSALWFARWRSLDVVLRRLLEGTPTEDAFGWGEAGSPRQMVLAGYVGRQIGDRRTARVQLRRAVGRYREHVAGLRPDRPEEVTQAWETWVETLERDGRTT